MDRRRFLRDLMVAGAGLSLTGLAAACDDSGPSNGATGSSGSAAATTTTAAAATTSSAAPVPASIAGDAFLAGFPLVTTVRTMQTFAGLIGVNRLYVTPGLVNPTSHLVVAPNRDTVYALAVLDLRAGPQQLTMPAITDRYHVVQFLDAWMGGFGFVGTRTTGGKAGTWVVTPPSFTGALPDGTTRFACPTNFAIVLGRIRAIDDADAAAAAAVGRQIRLETLGASQPTPGFGTAAGTPQNAGANGLAYFDELGDALDANPPATLEQRAAIAAAGDLGVGAARHPSHDATAADRRVLRRAVVEGLRDLGKDRALPARRG